LTAGTGSDQLILDRDLPQEESRLGIGTRPANLLDREEASKFTLEAELVRLSNLVEEKGRSVAGQSATRREIKMRMEQAEEDKDRLSKRGITAFNHLQSTIQAWGRREK
jgi:hypothetical protein